MKPQKLQQIYNNIKFQKLKNWNL